MSTEANGKTIGLYGRIFLEVTLFYQQPPDDFRVQELKKEIAAVPKCWNKCGVTPLLKS